MRQRVPKFGDSFQPLHSSWVEELPLTDKASHLTESPLRLVLLEGGWPLVRDPQDSDRQVFQVCSSPNDESLHPQIPVRVQGKSDDHPIPDTVE